MGDLLFLFSVEGKGKEGMVRGEAVLYESLRSGGVRSVFRGECSSQPCVKENDEVACRILLLSWACECC